MNRALTLFASSAVAALLMLVQPALAASIETGKAKAAACAACHGEDGNSTNPGYPRLAGQYASYLIQVLHEYQAGQRKQPVMQAIARGLSNEDVRDISAYYASLPGKLDLTKHHIQGDD